MYYMQYPSTPWHGYIGKIAGEDDWDEVLYLDDTGATVNGLTFDRSGNAWWIRGMATNNWQLTTWTPPDGTPNVVGSLNLGSTIATIGLAPSA
jgi:hypothetical protein